MRPPVLGTISLSGVPIGYPAGNFMSNKPRSGYTGKMGIEALFYAALVTA
jgi:hypothetical protein